MDLASSVVVAPRVPAGWPDDPLWYKDAIIYQLHVKAYFDSNNDGLGDFAGLTRKLDYIASLGVNAVWLLPFYPSPLRDDGYDIADYRGIHPDYGSRADFRQFIREAHRHGIKVITELVINHTSDQHPWFQAARRSPPGSPKRNYYVWSDTNQKWADTRIIFSDSERSNWAWDGEAGAYYWHRFFSHQPDLNFDNPSVVRAIMRVMRYWLDQGVDGMRLDAIPYLCARDGTRNENLPETHAVLRYLRAELDRHYSNRFFLAEANQWPEDVREYFGNGDECHMAYHFPLMPRIYMALAQEDRHPITDIMDQTPDIPDTCQWAIFLRNHDELTLEMVTERERDTLLRVYAHDRRMRLNLGIRRRLAPLMGNNRDKLKLANSLLLSMPGSPILYYGDEIGMGDNVFLGDRNGVRTPMQWSPDRNAGFSRADPAQLYLPPIMDAVYGYQAVNVEAQSVNQASLLHWTRRVIAARKAHQAFGRGTLRFLRPGNRKVLAYLREYRDEVILCVANLSSSSQPVELDLSSFKARVPVELLDHTAFLSIGDLPYPLTLPGFSFFWFVLSAAAAPPDWHDARLAPAELPVLVLPEGWRTLFSRRISEAGDLSGLLASRMRTQFETQVLPAFLGAQRWFGGSRGGAAQLADASEWNVGSGNWLLATVRVAGRGGAAGLYVLPLSLAWDEAGEERLATLGHCSLARVRQRARVGVLYDALWDDSFCRALIDAVAGELSLPVGNGHIRFSAGPAADLLQAAGELQIQRPPPAAHETTLIFGDRLRLKLYRRLGDGLSEELDMARFLSRVVPAPRIAPLAGAIEYRDRDGRRGVLALLLRHIPNQGSAWNYALDYLQRHLAALLGGAGPAPDEDVHGAFLAVIETLGRRTGEVHRALATPSGDADFDPEPIVPADLERWSAAIARQAGAALDRLEARRATLEAPLRDAAERLLAARLALLDRIGAPPPAAVGATRTRWLGDFHLGRVVLADDDFFVVDYAAPAGHGKCSPLRDAASILRSFAQVAAAALDHVGNDRPGERDALVPHARRWQDQAGSAFLAAYRQAMRGCPAYPGDEAAAALIELFELGLLLDELRRACDDTPERLAALLAELLPRIGSPDET